MNLSNQQLSEFVSRMHAAARRYEQHLNAADATLGDGDTGSMLRRILAAMAAVDVEAKQDIAGAATALAQATMKETGSSLGTLVGTCLLTIAKEARARGGGLDAADMADVTAAMADAVAARGKASVGDKTVLDSLTAISEALGAGPATQASAAAAARAILTDLRGKPCRAGRARMYPERSVGADDPGMLAAALLLDEVETADAD